LKIRVSAVQIRLRAPLKSLKLLDFSQSIQCLWCILRMPRCATVLK
jgi:hypothetical protein